jgi:hypothetical protein
MLKRVAPLALLSLILGPVVLLGCREEQPKLPETFPVHGTVVGKDGKPVAGGGLTFKLEGEQVLTTAGTVGEDGTFTLRTFAVGIKTPGAMPGKYRAVYTPPTARAEAIFLRDNYTVKPGDNEFKLVLP